MFNMSRRELFEEKNLKRMIYIFSITLVLSIISFVLLFVMYNRKLKENSKNSLLELGNLDAIVSNEDLEEASYSSDKTVNNTVQESNTTNIENKTSDNSNKNKKNTEQKKNNVSKTPVQAVVEEKKEDLQDNINIENVEKEKESEVTEETNIIENTQVNSSEISKELSFIAPVSGDIIKDFAMDTLIYSNTLEEWTTHSGIDIKANKTSIVVASEEGTVESIKNDPRYGLTIVIAHENGFKTIYSNLLTTEFVSEGKKVEKGETIATVGETASFEISDEAHLHFEMYKDGEVVNPTIYLKEN